MTWGSGIRGNNPADASKGSLNSADISDADTRIGSSASFAPLSFLRFFFQNSTYYPRSRSVFKLRAVRCVLESLFALFGTRFRFFIPRPPTTQPPPTRHPFARAFFFCGGRKPRCAEFALNSGGAPGDFEHRLSSWRTQALLVLNQEFPFSDAAAVPGNANWGGAIFL